jgi:hypothetical protein
MEGEVLRWVDKYRAGDQVQRLVAKYINGLST